MDFSAAEAFILNKLKTELPGNLYYHSYHHVMDVLKASILYAEMEKISEYDSMLLQTAVLFHDSGFTIQSKDHEELGCRIVRESLPTFGYTSPVYCTARCCRRNCRPTIFWPCASMSPFTKRPLRRHWTKYRKKAVFNGLTTPIFSKKTAG